MADNRVEELSSPPVILNPLCLFRTIFCFFLRSKAGYHHVEFFPEHRVFLAFSWDFGTGMTRYFQFTVLPFGLSSAPFIFSKLLKPLETLWRSHDIPVAIFFDDGVGAGQWLEAANHNSSVVQSDLARAGFQINHEKSNWQPKPCFSSTGYTFDTYSGLICATDSRIGKLLSELVDIRVTLEESRFVHVERIASIVGQILSLSPSCRTVTQIMTRYLHFIVNSRHSWNSSVLSTSRARTSCYFGETI